MFWRVYDPANTYRRRNKTWSLIFWAIRLISPWRRFYVMCLSGESKLMSWPKNGLHYIHISHKQWLLLRVVCCKWRPEMCILSSIFDIVLIAVVLSWSLILFPEIKFAATTASTDLFLVVLNSAVDFSTGVVLILHIAWRESDKRLCTLVYIGIWYVST